jgi:ribosomal protein S18 acetylase RimI-like enzyme
MSLTPIGLQIRPIAEEDYYDVFRLHRLLADGIFCQGENDFARIFKGFFQSADREAFVATVHNRVIGFVTLYYFDVFHYGGQVASIQELVVTEEFRGRGVGQALIEFVKKQSTERHCHGLEVATDLWQGGAKSFYKRCGFYGRSLMVAT